MIFREYGIIIYYYKQNQNIQYDQIAKRGRIQARNIYTTKNQFASAL